MLSISYNMYYSDAAALTPDGAASLDGPLTRTPSASGTYQGFQGYGLSIIRIRYLVPRKLFCVVFSRSAILRIEACLKSTLPLYVWNPLTCSSVGGRIGSQMQGVRGSRSPKTQATPWSSARRMLVCEPLVGKEAVHPIPNRRFGYFRIRPLDILSADSVRKGVWATQPLEQTFCWKFL